MTGRASGQRRIPTHDRSPLALLERQPSRAVRVDDEAGDGAVRAAAEADDAAGQVEFVLAARHEREHLAPDAPAQLQARTVHADPVGALQLLAVVLAGERLQLVAFVEVPQAGRDQPGWRRRGWSRRKREPPGEHGLGDAPDDGARADIGHVAQHRHRRVRAREPDGVCPVSAERSAVLDHREPAVRTNHQPPRISELRAARSGVPVFRAS